MQKRVVARPPGLHSRVACYLLPLNTLVIAYYASAAIFAMEPRIRGSFLSDKHVWVDENTTVVDLTDMLEGHALRYEDPIRNAVWWRAAKATADSPDPWLHNPEDLTPVWLREAFVARSPDHALEWFAEQLDEITLLQWITQIYAKKAELAEAKRREEDAEEWDYSQESALARSAALQQQNGGTAPFTQKSVVKDTDNEDSDSDMSNTNKNNDDDDGKKPDAEKDNNPSEESSEESEEDSQLGPVEKDKRQEKDDGRDSPSGQNSDQGRDSEDDEPEDQPKPKPTKPKKRPRKDTGGRGGGSTKRFNTVMRNRMLERLGMVFCEYAPTGNKLHNVETVLGEGPKKYLTFFEDHYEGIGYDRTWSMIEATKAVEDGVGVQEWIEVMRVWRLRQGHDMRNPGHDVFDTTGLVVEERAKEMVEVFRVATIQDGTSVCHPCEKRYSVVRLREMLNELEKTLQKPGAVGRDVRSVAKEHYFQMIYGAGANHKTNLKEWRAFERMLSLGKRWLMLTEKFGYGVLAVIPASRVSDTFIERTLSLEHIKVWIVMLKTMVPGLADWSKKMEELLLRFVQKLEPPPQMLRLEYNVGDWNNVSLSQVQGFIEPAPEGEIDVSGAVDHDVIMSDDSGEIVD